MRDRVWSAFQRQSPAQSVRPFLESLNGAWAEASSSCFLCRFKTTKIEQNIATGGTSKTRTPMFRFLMKCALFDPASDARHIAHWANPAGVNVRIARLTRTISKMYFSTRMTLNPRYSTLFGATGSGSLNL
jgi:hypothetical protein